LTENERNCMHLVRIHVAAEDLRLIPNDTVDLVACVGLLSLLHETTNWPKKLTLAAV